MKFNPLPSAEFLRVCMDYDPKTGLLRWKKRPREHFADARSFTRWNNRYPGKEAFGCVHATGGKYGAVNNQWFYAHRVIWKIVTGEDPEVVPDHEDRNRANNKWSNLRAATWQQNSANHSLRQDNSSGHAGVFFSIRQQRWKAQISIARERIHLGTFASKEAAISARILAERKYHREFTPDVQRKRA